VAIGLGHDRVVTAVHAGDHAIYPDCRPEFIDALNEAIRLGTDGAVEIRAPFVNVSKTDIARIGYSAGAPFDLSWSCYEGGTLHCGRCGTCTERREAFRDSGVPDPTIYKSEVLA
jgi:7-cyano-7-deazaguanine synthase